MVTKEIIFFTFDNKFYDQADGVAMDSHLGPILANIFLSDHEENWLNKCPIEFKRTFYRRYVDIFVLFESLETAHSFHEYMFSKHQNINFRVELEDLGSLPILDVKIYRESGKLVASVNRKRTSSGDFTYYKSFIPTYQKRGLLNTFHHSSFSICFDFKKFHLEIDHLKSNFRKDNYPPNFIDSCIKSFFNDLYTPKVIVHNARDVFVKFLFQNSKKA